MKKRKDEKNNPQKRLTITKSLRFSPEEWSQIQLRMDNNDYLSFSKFVRDVLLKGHVTVSKVTMSDRSVRNQINEISARVGKIGNNYNQFVKKYQSLAKAETSKGRPLIDTKVTVYYIKRLEEFTSAVADLQRELIEITSRFQLDERNDQKDTTPISKQ